MSSQLPENFYKSIFDNMLDGSPIVKCFLMSKSILLIIFISRLTKILKKLTGLKNIVGKRATEIIPKIGESNPELFEVSGRVSLTGKPENFENIY